MPKSAGQSDSTTTSGGSVLKRLAPGAPGTQRWLDRYGESLVCVRYRQDETIGRRYTTVEIIVDERSYRDPTALVRIAYGETNLRRQAREQGGRWLPERKLWRLPLRAVQQLGLQNRVVENCQ